MVKALSDFMVKNKMENMDLATYKGFGNDVPVKDYLLRRAFGSWNRVLAVVAKRYPVQVAPAPAPAPKKVVEKKVVAKKEVQDVKEK